MSMMSSSGRNLGDNAMFRLEYPQSIGVYATYAEAQGAIDALAERAFPINNLEIVGTDLKLVERVTGRKTWWTVIQQGMFSGLSTALMIAMILFLLDPERDFVGLLLEALMIGLVIGVGFALLGQAMARGRRDYTSVSQTIPSKFELLCEHRVAVQARELLAQTPAGRAAAFDPARGVQAGYPQGGYGVPNAAPQQQPYPAPQQQPYPTQPPYAPAPQPPYDGPQTPSGQQGWYPPQTDPRANGASTPGWNGQSQAGSPRSQFDPRPASPSEAEPDA